MLAINGRQDLPSPQMDFAATSSIKQINGALSTPHHRHMWIVTGPAGCGKSTIAQYLARELRIPYIEGDDVSMNLPRLPVNGPMADIIHLG